jgi:hypothetical protein
VERKKSEYVINNYYVKEKNVDTLKLLLEKVIDTLDKGVNLTAISFVEDKDVFKEQKFSVEKVWTRYVKMKKD